MIFRKRDMTTDGFGQEAWILFDARQGEED